MNPSDEQDYEDYFHQEEPEPMPEPVPEVKAPKPKQQITEKQKLARQQNAIKAHTTKKTMKAKKAAAVQYDFTEVEDPEDEEEEEEDEPEPLPLPKPKAKKQSGGNNDVAYQNELLKLQNENIRKEYAKLLKQAKAKPKQPIVNVNLNSAPPAPQNPEAQEAKKKMLMKW
jgi:hypothetical protein